MKKSSKTADCPECAAEVPLPDDASAGEIVECPDCGAELEIRRGKPVTLALASKEEEEEDWDE
jgi:alpha-aminoadipate carrier protein LysW